MIYFGSGYYDFKEFRVCKKIPVPPTELSFKMNQPSSLLGTIYRTFLTFEARVKLNFVVWSYRPEFTGLKLEIQVKLMSFLDSYCQHISEIVLVKNYICKILVQRQDNQNKAK